MGDTVLAGNISESFFYKCANCCLVQAWSAKGKSCLPNQYLTLPNPLFWQHNNRNSSRSSQRIDLADSDGAGTNTVCRPSFLGLLHLSRGLPGQYDFKMTSSVHCVGFKLLEKFSSDHFAVPSELEFPSLKLSDLKSRTESGCLDFSSKNDPKHLFCGSLY